MKEIDKQKISFSQKISDTELMSSEFALNTKPTID